MRPRIITPANVAVPSGGSLYNEAIAACWEIEIESLPGSWPTPTARDLQRLDNQLIRGHDERQRPVLLDGLIGCAAPAALSAARAAGVRVVLLVHLPLSAETGLSPAQAAELSDTERRAVTEASALACTSQWAAADLRRRYGVSTIAVAEPGVVAAPLAPGSDPPLLITPASFSARKNHALLLRAFTDPLIAELGWSALWVGAEPVPGARRALQQQVVDVGLAGRIEIRPAATGSDLDALYAQSNLVLLPSLAETYAMVVTEGYARGISAIVGAGTGAAATLIGGHANRLLHHDPGAAVALNDPHAWARVLHKWIRHESVRATWRASALSRREDQPTWGRAAHTLMQVMTPEVV